VLFCNVTAGIGILEQASPMIQDFFPDIGAKEAAGYVGLLSLANMSGRYHERAEEAAQPQAVRRSRFTHEPEEARR
jgi:hypothetical protein